MEERFEKMLCPNCGKKMETGLTMQGYQHPLVWYPGKEALDYWDGVKLVYAKDEKLGGLRRFTRRMRTVPTYFHAWYCEDCELLVTDTKIKMEKA